MIPSAADAVSEQIRLVLAATADLLKDPAGIKPGADLFAAGLTSLGSVRVVLALEEEFGFIIPDELITRKNLSTIEAMASMIASAAADSPDPGTGAAGAARSAADAQGRSQSREETG